MEKETSTSLIRSSECKEHGTYEAKGTEVLGKVFFSGCPLCIKALKDEEEKKISSVCWTTKRTENMTLENYVVKNEQQAKIMERILKYVGNFKRVRGLGSCLCFAGSPGTGKTHLGIGIAKKISEAGFSVSYDRISDMISRIFSSYGVRGGETDIVIIEKMAAFDLLVIDEIGIKNMTDAESSILFRVIDRRYEDVKPTILISNLNVKDLEKCIGTRTMDRMYENHGAVFEFDWESKRREKPQKAT